jgi:hypothetical protein
MPNRAKKNAKKPQSIKKAPSTPPSTKPEDPVTAFLARLGAPKDAERELDPARRREVARRAARMSSIAAKKAEQKKK